MKACKAACIGCGKCEKECKFGAITIEGNVSYIDFNKCRLCKKCVEACPTKAIHAVNFPAPKPKPVTSETSGTSVSSSPSIPSDSSEPKVEKEEQA